MLRPFRTFHSTGYTAAEQPEKDSAGSSARNELREGFGAKKARNERLGLKRPRIPEAEYPVIIRHLEFGPRNSVRQPRDLEAHRRRAPG